MTLPANLSVYISALLFVLGAYAFALYIGLIVWAFRDIHARSRDVLAQIMVTLLVALFSVPGVLVYLLLRPHTTLSEEYERSLAEEALMQDLEEQRVCLGCQRRIEPDFIVCPYCHHQLRLRCVGCGRLLSPDWDVCPYCGLLRDQEEGPEEEAEEDGLESEEQAFEAIERFAPVERIQPALALSAAEGGVSLGDSIDEEMAGAESPAPPVKEAQPWQAVFDVEVDQYLEGSTDEEVEGAEPGAGQPATGAIEEVVDVEEAQTESLASMAECDKSPWDATDEEVESGETRSDLPTDGSREQAPVVEQAQTALAAPATDGDQSAEVSTEEEIEGAESGVGETAYGTPD